ncbi:MAG TPA: glycosyltransferase family 2 protein [Thermoleophilaceae bacterium]
MPTTAVIIVTTNEAHFLPETLGRLARQTLAPTRTIVVDNGSSDDSVELVERDYPSAQLVRMGRNSGFAVANNAGVRAADGCELIALLNADAYPAEDWLERLVAAAEQDGDSAMWGARMMKAREPELLDGAGDVYHVAGLADRRYHGQPLAEVADALAPAETFSVCGGAALYRRDVFLEVGGFDEDYFLYYDDVDLAFRIRLAGWRGRYVPDAVVAHVGSATTGLESDLSLYHIQRNIVWTWVKCMPWPLWVLYLPLHLYANASMTAMYVLRGRGKVVGRAKLDALRGLRRQLRKRRAIQRVRRVGAAELLPVLSRGLGIFVPRALRG